MSTELKTILAPDDSSLGDVYLTRFYGGPRDGRCLQLTQSGRYIQLNKALAEALMARLGTWETEEEIA